MDRATAEKLMVLFDTGEYIISVNSRYVDSPVKQIYEVVGDIVFDSEVYSGKSLTRGVDIYDVSVSKKVNEWWKV